MVFSCQLWFSFKEEEIQEDMITQTKSTSTSQDYYTASSNLNSSMPDSYNKPEAQKPNNLRIFTPTELNRATRNFCRSSKIIKNESGDIHRGVFNECQVNVKRVKEQWLGDKQQWLTEINNLGLVNHPNLVALVGYCIEKDARFLVYEYTPNRRVKDLLHTSSSETPLSWTMRLKVAQDVARGLAYLHEGTSFGMIFGDFKSSNVFLDEQWNAKLYDFGSTRLCLQGLNHAPPTYITTGYEAIEYMERGCLSAKTDVWSYGVFLCELITGKHPLTRKQPENLQLVEWVKPFLGSKNVQLIMDSRLKCKYSLETAQKLALIAKKCLSENPKSRPKMGKVLEMVNELTVVPSPATNPEPSHKSLVRGVAIKLKRVFTCTTKEAKDSWRHKK